MQPIRIGLIGCGGIATSAHLPAMGCLRGRVKLVAAADVNLEAARAAAAPWDATAHADYRALLERRDVDMVLIATPEFLHREQAVAAAEAGKHILCEKPMAASLAAADAMIAASGKVGVRLMVGHSRRSTRRYLEVRRAIDRGEIGEVRLLRENERRMRLPLGQPDRVFSPENWRGDPNRSAGAALSNGIHEADLLRWFAGAEPVSIFAEHAVTRPDNRGVPDFLTFTVRFANGAVGSSEATYSAPPSYGAFHHLEIYGTRGAVRAKDPELITATRYGDLGASYPHVFDLLLHNLEAYTRQLAGFVDAIVSDRPVPLAPEEARAALRLALAAVESSRSGRVVRLNAGGGA